MGSKLKYGAATAVLIMLGFAPTASAQTADAPGDASTQAQLVVGQAVDAEISPAGDADWYRLRVEQGQRYALTLDGQAAEGGEAIDPTLGIYDRSGNQVAFNDDANGSLNSALTYIPSQSGEVFVEARGFSSEATGRYHLNVTASAAPPDDFGNDSSTRGRIASGGAANGAIDFEGDVDWYRLSVRNTQSYRITLDGSGASPLQDPYLRIVDGAGNELASADDSESSLNPVLQWRPEHSGTVYVEASAYANAYAGGYTLNVTSQAAPTDATSADTRTRGRIAVGGQVTASLDYAGDKDWYRITLEAGQSYRFGLTSSGDTPVDDPYVSIHNAAGEELAADDDGGEGLNSYLEFTAPSSGVYYVEARGFSEEAQGGYTLSAQAGDIPSDTTTDVSLSAEGDYREGNLGSAGDTDWYRIQLAEGQAVRIGLSSAEGEDALGDPLVTVHGPDGAELAGDDDGGEGLNSWLEFQAPSAGAYYISAQAFGGESTGRYVVSVTAGEVAASPDGAEYLLPNGEGRVSTIGGADDADWFAVDLIEGRPYRFYLDGVDPDPLGDPYLRLYDSDGNEVASDDDGGTGLNSYVTFYSATGGTYYAAASGFSGSTGHYWLRVTDTDVPGQIGTDEYLDANGDDRVSRIDMPGDLDAYRVNLDAGVAYTIEVKGHGDNPVADPFLALIDGEGQRVTSDDDSGPGLDARLQFTPTTGGPYFLQASGLGGSTGWYQITIVRQ